MASRTGFLLILTGVGHSLVGLVIFHQPLVAIARDGVLATIGPHVVEGLGNNDMGREAAFWFLLYGPILCLQGQIANHAVARGDAAILRLLAWNLLATGAAGAAIMPVSGFWLVIGLALLAFRQAARIVPGIPLRGWSVGTQTRSAASSSTSHR